MINGKSLACNNKKIRRTKMKKIAITVIAILTLAALAGCNTVSGIGKDVQSVGQATQRAGGR